MHVDKFNKKAPEERQMTIAKRLKRILVERLHVEENDVVPSARWEEDLCLDFIDLGELIISIEEEFSTPSHRVEISDKDAEKIITVQDLIDYLVGNELGSDKRDANLRHSVEIRQFCNDYIVHLGRALNIAIEQRQEYEAGFNYAMDILLSGSKLLGNSPKGVLLKDRPQMLTEVKRYAEEAGISYNKLSPLNQFLVTIPPYVFYCLEKYLPNDPDLRQEARNLMSTKGFPRYLQEELGYPISQKIKGVFWRPQPPKFLRRLFGERRSD